MNIHNLERIFPPQIYLRGKDYFKRDKILEFNSAGNQRIDALVEGSGGSEYNVFIDLDEHGNIVDYGCDCPYGGLCKHLAAVMIAWNDRPEELINPLNGAQVKPAQTLLPKTLYQTKEKEPESKLPLTAEGKGGVRFLSFQKQTVIRAPLI